MDFNDAMLEHAARTLDRRKITYIYIYNYLIDNTVRNGVVRMLKGFFDGTSPPADESSQPASVIPQVSVNTDLPIHTDSVMSPHRTVTSPISILPNASCTRACVMTKAEGDEGHVVSRYTAVSTAVLS